MIILDKLDGKHFELVSRLVGSDLEPCPARIFIQNDGVASIQYFRQSKSVTMEFYGQKKAYLPLGYWLEENNQIIDVENLLGEIDVCPQVFLILVLC